MCIDVIARRRRLCSLAAATLLAATLAGSSFAQNATAFDAAPPGFPGAATLPPMPEDPRLPGANPRQCGPTKWSALCAEGRWTAFSNMKVELKAPRFNGVYTMEQPENGDNHTTYREQAGTKVRGGEIVFVNEDAFAFRTREKFKEPETILDEMMSAPIMVTQLATLLLDQGALVGPDEITKPVTFSARNDTQFLRAQAPSAASLFGPPWELTGSVAPATEGGLTFSLHLAFRPVDTKGRIQARKRDAITLSGTVTYGERRKAMSDTFDLVGWKLLNRNQDAGEVKSMGEARQAVGGR